MPELFKKPNSAALAFIVAGSAWFIVGTLYGLISAIHLMAPEFFNNIPALVFGRVRPSHVNTVLYGFVVTTLIGLGLYYMPALLKRTLWSEPLGWISFFFWNITVLSGPVFFSYGITQGREYTEYIWPFDVTFMIAVLTLIFNLVMTIIKRVENVLYVSVWYFVASFIWISGSYVIGNVMWHPSTGALPGILDSIFLWFYAHALPGLLLTPLAIGVAYFVIPRVTKTPLYSHTLSIVGFWTLVTFYSHIGGHHLLQAPIPHWLKTMSVVDSMMMFIPVIIVIINLWMTMRGKSLEVMADPAAKWVAMGLIWYLIVGAQGSIQSLPQIQKVTHFNNWTVAHAHIAVLGFSGFIAIGGVWHIIPLITGRELFSKRLANLQFGMVMIGLTGFFVVLTIAGLIQGEAWYNGETVYRVLPQIAPYMILRAVFGLFIIAGAFIGFYNLLMSIRKPEASIEVKETRVPINPDKRSEI
ncbi:MAG TPA: cbb3-type cytochrome c oxidase subunit I [Bacteroidales bacterium]|nr:cbb3-type cytochrome c oxidase subunit I [Bacteroidales bacterium]